MERIESLSKRARIKKAIAEGYASECIGKRCVCWNVCSRGGKEDIKVCTSDLSKGFYKHFDD